MKQSLCTVEWFTALLGTNKIIFDYILSESLPSRTDPLFYTLITGRQLSVAGRWADSSAEGRLKVAERQRPVHGPLYLSSTPPGQSRPATHVEVNKSR